MPTYTSTVWPAMTYTGGVNTALSTKNNPAPARANPAPLTSTGGINSALTTKAGGTAAANNTLRSPSVPAALRTDVITTAAANTTNTLTKVDVYDTKREINSYFDIVNAQVTNEGTDGAVANES